MQLSVPEVQEKEAFFNLHIFSIDLFPTIITFQSIALSAIPARQKIFQVQPRHKNNISVKPIVFSPFFTHIEY